jgi:hypothetical protein
MWSVRFPSGFDSETTPLSNPILGLAPRNEVLNNDKRGRDGMELPSSTPNSKDFN